MADTKEHVDDDHQLSLLPEKKEKTHISENLRVLAIDDSVVCLKVLAFELQKCGYRVTATTKASEAIEMLRKNKDEYDIVITDVMRSDMDGFKLLEIIGLELDIPVIMTSANSDMKTVEKGVKHGARDYLVKPVRIEILRNIWQHVIRKTVYNPKSDAMEAKTVRNSLPNKRHKRDEDESGQSSEESLAQKKSRVVWKPWLHEKFVAAVQQLEVDKAVPKKILEIMNEPQLTRESVASHLQKYRNALRKQKESMSQETKSHMDTNGISHFCSPVIHARVGNHGLRTINHSSSYSEYEMSSFMGKNRPFLPLNYHDIVLQQNRVPSEDVNQMWKNMAIPVLKNVAPGAVLTADPELSAMKYQTIQHQRNMVDHDYGQISSQLSGIDAGPKHPDSFTRLIVGNSSRNLPILSRPYSFSPCASSPGAPHQMYGDAATQTNPFSEPHSVLGRASNSLPGQQDRRSLVSFCAKGSEFRGLSTASPVDMQGGLSGNDQVGYTQSLLDSCERENNGHQMIEDSPDDDLSVIVKQFASDAAPRI